MNRNLSYTSLIYFVLRANFIGVSFSILLETSKQDSWIVIILSYLIGIIPLLLIKHIATYESDKNITEKIKIIFPKMYKLIILFMLLFFFFITLIAFSNLSNFITSQFLSKTPNFIILLSFIIPIALLVSKDINIIARTSLILFYFAIFLFFASVLGLIFNFDIDNFRPIFNNQIFTPTYSYIGFHIMPLFMILIYPNNNIINSMYKGYLLSAFSLFITMITIVGILGIDLCLIYQYPEFHILKRSYEGIINIRLENLLAIQCIFDIFIFCVIGLKNCNLLLNIKKGSKQLLIPIILFITTNLLFLTNSASTNNSTYIISNIFSICFTILIFLLSIKIFIKKRMINHS